MILSPTLHTAGLAAAEAGVNRLLRLDPAGLQQLARLDGHVFQLQCTAPAIDVYMLPQSNGLRLCGVFDGRADTVLSGSADELFKLATASDPANALINGELTLSGNSQALIELQTIIKGLELDWEAPLTDLLGDIAGHQIAEGLRHGHRFFSQAFGSLRRQANDYFLYESDLVPARWELDQFYRDINQLQQRSERLQARVNKLLTKRPSNH